MVGIALAGGSGQIAQEVLDVLVASGKHEVLILSRKLPEAARVVPGVKWHVVAYEDTNSLVEALRGIHTVLSFIQLLSDPEQTAQRNLIDAAIAAGVKRFAPSEYGSKGTVDMPWWYGKEKIRKYLEEVNKDGQVLEYTLFQPGLLLDYLAYPHKTAKHVDPLQTVFDIQNKRAIVVDGHEDAIMTLTTVADVASVIALAVDYHGKWPTTSGISGNRATFAEVVEIGTRIRGAGDQYPVKTQVELTVHVGSPFVTSKAKIEDLEAGNLRTSWGLEAVHKAVAEDQASAMLKAVAIGILKSSVKGAWDVSDEMNQLFPGYEFTRIEDFLVNTWEGKP